MAKYNEQKNDGDMQEKVLYINRCSKVVKGGRKFSFSALILVGDCNGKVGFGFGKANELTDAIRKGGDQARKNVMNVTMENTTIPHETFIQWDGASVLLKPAREGSGVVAGSVIRNVLEFAGFKDVMAKSLGSNNPLNQVRAVFKALSGLQTHEEIEKARAEA